MLCLRRPPERAQPSGDVCLSVHWCDGEELGRSEGQQSVRAPSPQSFAWPFSSHPGEAKRSNCYHFFIVKQGAGKKT